MNQAHTSFQKLLPTHSQMREDEDPEALPCFGQTDDDLHENLVATKPEPDSLDHEVNQLLMTSPHIAELFKGDANKNKKKEKEVVKLADLDDEL